ncbi:FAD-dependent monooxygenase [Sulfitobacter porphyrae]|uniref:FAD-dependent monooxygenase n=1 Tax=Sulfitobacter porphyrae TaxID=1246864 RepID=A0ABW2BBP6_9RHOB
MTRTIKTSVCIIGSGPAGLLLSQLLANAGIDTVVLDRKDRAYIEGRIRAACSNKGQSRLWKKPVPPSACTAKGCRTTGLSWPLTATGTGLTSPG